MFAPVCDHNTATGSLATYLTEFNPFNWSYCDEPEICAIPTLAPSPSVHVPSTSKAVYGDKLGCKASPESFIKYFKLNCVTLFTTGYGSIT